MIVSIAVWAVSGRARWPSNPLNVAYIAFAISVVLCWAASPWAESPLCETEVENYLKLFVFYIMLVTSVWREEDLRVICLGFLFAMGLYLAHSFREYLAGRHTFRMEIHRMIGVDVSMGDPNSFSASIVYSLPFVLPSWSALKCYRRCGRLLLIGYVALSLLCIMLTGSRGSFIAVIGLALLLGFRSHRRWQVLALLILLSPLSWFALPDELKDRFRTILDSSAGPASARESQESRSEGFWIGLGLWQKHPLTGVGPGAWRPSTLRWIESHHLYGQVLGEMGTLGLLSFGAIVLLFRSNVNAVKEAYRRQGWPKDFLYYVADASGIALILLLLLGLAAHSLFRHNWLWYGAFMIVARNCVRQRLAAQKGAPLMASV